jgi:predicted ester cyclase
VIGPVIRHPVGSPTPPRRSACDAEPTPKLIDVTGLLALWTEPLPVDDGAALEAFARFYTDPVTVNGTDLPLPAMLARARALQAAYAGRTNTVQELVTTDDELVFAIEVRCRHVGPLTTPLGVVAPTGREIVTRAIDILTTTGGRVRTARVVSDELGVLTQLGAVRLT